MRRALYILFFLLAPFLSIFAQEEKSLLIDGNDAYNRKSYLEAEKKYKEALGKKRNYSKANYNLGNAYYKQNKFEEAREQYDVVLNSTNNKDTLSKVYHNLGNSYVKMKKYQEAVNAYKNALKMNHRDEDTRYNLAWALKKLEEQKKKENKKNQQQQQQQQQQQDQQKQQQQQDQQQQQQQQQQQSQGITKEQAQRMLEELKNAEAKILEKKKQKNKNNPKNPNDKDW